jgi:hypothetical protein
VTLKSWGREKDGVCIVACELESQLQILLTFSSLSPATIITATHAAPKSLMLQWLNTSDFSRWFSPAAASAAKPLGNVFGVTRALKKEH